MDKLYNIISLPGQEGTNPAKAQESRLSENDVRAFVTALRNSSKALENNPTAAKLSRILEEKNASRAEMLEILQKMPAGEDDGLLKKLAALLKQAPEVKPALNSDLTASLSTSLQESPDTAKLIGQLQGKFAALGDITAEALADFRQDAIQLMKDMGLDAEDIEASLVKLTMSLGSGLTDEQATLLMMPFSPDTPAQAAAAETVAKPQPAIALPPAPVTPQELAEQQLQQQAANAPDAQKDAAPSQLQKPAQQPAPQPQTIAPQPQPDTQAAAKAPQQPASNLSLVNGFATEGGFDGGGFGGQSFSQNGGYAPGAMTGLQTASAATPGSFANYMGAAGNTQMTQMIALQIQHNAQLKSETFRMQLHPSELGLLEVRLKFGRDGSLKAHLVADKADTLSLLQKDSAQLHRVLQDAGIEMDEGSLSFDLRQQQQDTNQSYNGNGTSSGNSAEDDGMTQANALQAKIAVEAMGSISQGGVNIMV